MRLNFQKDDWLHVLMAMRIAQKVLTKGEHYTALWDTRRGNDVIAQLMLLLKRDPNHPQIATKIDLKDALDMLPDLEPEAPPAPPAPPADLGAIEHLHKEVEFLRAAMQNLGNSAALAEVQALRDHINRQSDSMFEWVASADDRLLALERRK